MTRKKNNQNIYSNKTDYKTIFSNEHMKNTLENINMYNDDSKDKIIKVNKQIKFNENMHMKKFGT